MSSWAAVVTAPNAERLACADLERFSLPYIYFKQKFTVAHRGKVWERLITAFPRYLLVPFDQVWAIVRHEYMLHFTGLVRQGEGAASISDRLVNRLIQRCEPNYVLPAPLIQPKFKNGDHVYIDGDGPLSGHAAVFQQTASNGQLRVLLDWMGRYVPIDIDERDVSIKTKSIRILTSVAGDAGGVVIHAKHSL